MKLPDGPEELLAYVAALAELPAIQEREMRGEPDLMKMPGAPAGLMHPDSTIGKATADRYERDDLRYRAAQSGAEQGPDRAKPERYEDDGTLTSEDRGEGLDDEDDGEDEEKAAMIPDTHGQAAPDLTGQPSQAWEGWLHGQEPSTDPFAGAKVRMTALEGQLASLKAALARGAATAGLSDTTYAGPPSSPIAGPGHVGRDHVEQQPANLSGRRSTLTQLQPGNKHEGCVTVESVNLRADAGTYSGQQAVNPSPMERAVMASRVLPSGSSGGSYAAAFSHLTGRCPGE